MKNRLKPEIGYLVDEVESINAIGVTYVDTPGLRGLDFNFIAHLDATAEQAQEQFKESWQFAKQLYVLDFSSDQMTEFVRAIHSQDKVMSRYALGCMYQEIKAYFGEKEAEKLMKTIKEDVGVSMSTKNETEYFK